MKRLLVLLAMLSLGAPAWADEQIQAVQQALKDQGFYYGQVDGQGGAETDAAVRRYQIRQGLAVTGKLDAATLDSLNMNPKNDNALQAVPSQAQAPEPKPEATQPPKTVVESDHEFLQRHPRATPAPAPEEEVAPQPAQPQEPVEEAQTLPADYMRFFRKTPFETAPPVVQRSTVERSQERLAKEGFYRGIADGELSDSLSRALVAYQRDADLPPTGRLDMETLSDMNLLPRPRAVIRPPYPFSGPPVGRDVYRGIWVR